MSDVAQNDVPIQQEAIQTGNPTSESVFGSIGGAINYLLANAPQIGDLQASVLNQTDFQSLRGTNWVLADGRNVAGSQYQTVTGSSTIPDFRGTYGRASDDGGSAAGARGLDPNGIKAPGSYVADEFDAHTHTIGNGLIAAQPFSPDTGNQKQFVVMDPGTQNPLYPSGAYHGGGARVAFGIATDSTGGAETAPKTTYWNIFIKIN